MLERFMKALDSKEGGIIIWLVITILIIGFVAVLFSIAGLPYPI